MPPNLDPTSIHLIVGCGTSTSAFVEPTAGGQSCVLFASRNNTGEDTGDMMSTLDEVMSENAAGRGVDVDLVAQDIAQGFPLLEGVNLTDVASQLFSQRSASASSIKCNIYHDGAFAALVGDAAHATGGVTGQGCNSALVDSAVLADELEGSFKDGTLSKEAKIKAALLQYSQKQVLEGLALYDLAFGPKGDAGLLRSIRFRLSTLLDTVFGGKFGIGKPLLQTLLTTSLVPFSKIRRDRSDFYAEPFPDEEDFKKTIASISSS